MIFFLLLWLLWLLVILQNCTSSHCPSMPQSTICPIFLLLPLPTEKVKKLQTSNFVLQCPQAQHVHIAAGPVQSSWLATWSHWGTTVDSARSKARLRRPWFPVFTPSLVIDHFVDFHSTITWAVCNMYIYIYDSYDYMTVISCAMIHDIICELFESP